MTAEAWRRSTNQVVLRQVLPFYLMNLRGGWRHCLRGLDYVRCLEFPLAYSYAHFQDGLRYLDFGTGQSVFALVVASSWSLRVAVVDQSDWVSWQHRMAEKLRRKGLLRGSSFDVIRADGRQLNFRNGCFDRITAISAVEHIPGDGDTNTVRELGRVLAPGGRLIITVPYNDQLARDCFIEHDSYSEKYKGSPVFFQRHYDEKTLTSRLIKPSGLKLIDRKIFGEPKYQFFNTFYANPKIPVPLKLLYTWLAPLFAKWFVRVYNDDEIKTKPCLPVVTTEGALLVLEK